LSSFRQWVALFFFFYHPRLVASLFCYFAPDQPLNVADHFFVDMVQGRLTPSLPQNTFGSLLPFLFFFSPSLPLFLHCRRLATLSPLGRGFLVSVFLGLVFFPHPGRLPPPPHRPPFGLVVPKGSVGDTGYFFFHWCRLNLGTASTSPKSLCTPFFYVMRVRPLFPGPLRAPYSPKI